MTRLAKLTLLALIALSALAQDINLTVAADPPPGINNATGSVVGQRQSITRYYWVVARYPIGDSTGFGPIRVFNGAGTLGGGNSVIITWQPVTGATSYAVLRSSTEASPLSNNSCAACLVGTTTGTSITDNGGALTGFNRNPNAQRAVSTISINNRDFASPALRLGQYFPWQPVGSGLLADRPSTCTALQDVYICSGADCPVNPSVYYCTGTNSWLVISGAGGTPAGADREVQFNDAGSFGANSGFTFTVGNVVHNDSGYSAGDGVIPGELTLLEGTPPSAPANAGEWKFVVDSTGDWLTAIPDAGTTYYISRSSTKLNCVGQVVTTDANGVQSCTAAGGGDPYILFQETFGITNTTSTIQTNLVAQGVLNTNLTPDTTAPYDWRAGGINYADVAGEVGWYQLHQLPDSTVYDFTNVTIRAVFFNTSGTTDRFDFTIGVGCAGNGDANAAYTAVTLSQAGGVPDEIQVTPSNTNPVVTFELTGYDITTNSSGCASFDRGVMLIERDNSDPNGALVNLSSLTVLMERL